MDGCSHSWTVEAAVCFQRLLEYRPTALCVSCLRRYAGVLFVVSIGSLKKGGRILKKQGHRHWVAIVWLSSLGDEQVLVLLQVEVQAGEMHFAPPGYIQDNCGG